MKYKGEMPNFSRNAIRRFDGFTNTIDDLTYRVSIDCNKFAIRCTDNPKLEEADWDLVFLYCRPLDYKTILEVLKSYGFDKSPEWMERRMS